MPNFNFERFEPQDVGMDIVPRGSLSVDNQLIGPFGSWKPVLQHSNVSTKSSQQHNQYQLITDIKMLSEINVYKKNVVTGELQIPHTGELEMGEDNDQQYCRNKKLVGNPMISNFADQKKYTEVYKKTNTKKTLKEEEKTRRDFERNLSKLALFAYEAEEGIEILEDGQNPFLEEVDRLLQQINSPDPLLAEVDRLFQ